MRLELTPIVVAGISSVFGLISGAVGSFLAPWANWGVEQRRNRQAHQRQMIAEARLNFSGTPRRREDIRRNKAYVTIKGHLSQGVIGLIEQQNTTGGEQAIQDQLIGELSAWRKNGNWSNYFSKLLNS